MLHDPKRWTMPQVKPPMIEPWRQELLDAAERIRQRGWCQRQFSDLDGRVCAIGSIANFNANGTIDQLNPCTNLISAAGKTAIIKLSKYLLNGRSQSFREWPGAIISIWNDEPGRTAEEVIAAFEGAARS